MKVALALVFAFMVIHLAGMAGSPTNVVTARFVKLEIKEDGKAAGWYMVVDLVVWNAEGELGAEWNSVFIMPDDLSGRMKTVLRADHYSTERGDIRNLALTGTTVTFDLFRTPDRPVKIICLKRGEQSYDIEGTSYYFSSLLRKRITETWTMTDSIRLPSLTVYGQGD